MGPAAGLVSPQHGSREDAEAGAPEADRQQQHHSFAPTQLPLQAAWVLQWKWPTVQLHSETATSETHSFINATLLIEQVYTTILPPLVTAFGNRSLPGGAPQTLHQSGGLPWRLPLLPPGHQQLCHPCASSQEKKRAGGKGHPQLHAQRPQTSTQHLLQRRWHQRGLCLSWWFFLETRLYHNNVNQLQCFGTANICERHTNLHVIFLHHIYCYWLELFPKMQT